MKKLLVLSVLFAFSAVPAAIAGQASGCGLGSLVFEGQSGLVPNVLAVTTNGTFGSQTFGITTGTSNCNSGDTVQLEQAREEFVAVNYENLSEEMAQGQGQYVSAMAELMGCAPAVQGDFARMSKEKYELLFSTPQMDAEAWLGGLKQEMAQEPKLAGNCQIS